MHCAVPAGELDDAILRFCFEVVEPAVRDFWQDSLVRYAEEWDDAIHSDGYLTERLAALGVNLPPS